MADDPAQALFESRRVAAQLEIERHNLSDALDTARHRERADAHADLWPQVEAARRERDAVVAQRDRANAERDRALAAAHDAQAMLERVTSSTAWRVTGPARRVLQHLLGR